MFRSNQILASFNYFSDMYIPAHFRNDNEAELLEFIRQNSFGIIVSNGSEFPMATHLPFTIEKTENEIILTSHYAAANPQSKHLKTGDKVAIIFNGPHGYVSPGLYDSAESVPTWNYVAVHAIGEYSLSSEEEKDEMLRKMINVYDPNYLKQYEALSPKYLDGMKKGFTAFKIRVTELQGKYKLSQNKNPNERERIIDHFSSVGEKDLAEYMSKKLSTEK